MQSQHNGYVLLIILVYLQLFALLIMTDIRLLAGYKKQVHTQVQLGASRNEVMTIFNTLSQEANPACRLLSYSPAQIQKQPITWWKYHTCTRLHEDHVYYYFQIDLGRANCLAVADANNQLKAAHYYKNVVMLADNQETLADETIIVPDEEATACATTINEVKAGARRMRWL